MWVAIFILALGVIIYNNQQPKEVKSEPIVKEVPVAKSFKGVLNGAANGEEAYSFDSIKWTITNQAKAGNKLSFKFEKFSHNDGASFVHFIAPFYVGHFKGDCVVSTEEGRNEFGAMNVGDIYSTVKCTDTDAKELFISIANKKDSPLFLMYSYTKDSENVHKIRTIDITKITE